ncbi:chitooligosaccharidolytic beta-N-acetylglucosaminidase isoform X2 [Anabrus simplex]
MKAPKSSDLSTVLLMAVLGLAQSSLQEDSWSSQWTCEENKCVRSSVPSSNVNQLNSIHICSLTCGQYGSLWPRPTVDTDLGSHLVEFNPGRIRFDLSQLSGGQDARNMATQITRIFMENLAKECPNITDDPGTEVVISIATSSPSVELNMETNETYSLHLATEESKVTVAIRAVSLYGARHGLETLSQLTACSALPGGPLLMVADARVVDRPVFVHRGLLLDTGRNYLPESAIKRTLDAMAASKLNVLHWHITDSQSFPLQLPRVPKLARFGAYSSEKVYPAEMVSRVIEYARLRGIRVLLEFDAPSHAGNGWQWGESESLGSLAVCVNQQPWRHFCIQPPCGQLNPTNPELYNVLKDLYTDLVSLIPPDEIIHMGGDEVFFPCWNSTEEIVNWMAAKGMDRSQESFIQLWAYFQSSVLDLVDEQRGHSNTPTILWSSHLTEPKHIEKYLNKDRYIIETWVVSKDPLPKELLEKGYRLIIATKDAWYLDHGFWGSTAYHNWRVVYSNTILRHKGVLGGEVCMWGELVDDNSLDTKVWPRAAAAAERLWTDPVSSTNAAEHRMYEHRERLVRRGVKADALAPQYCYLNDGQCQ